jgi:hypothetical protein
MLFIKNKEIMLTTGMFSLAFAILLDRFAGVGPIINFLCGLFTGLSLTMNLGYLIKYRVEKAKIKR